MSKLGKIYEVRYGDDYYTKIVYPVVYENQAQWLCKVPGSSDIIHIYKSIHKVYTASEFLEKLKARSLILQFMFSSSLVKRSTLKSIVNGQRTNLL